MEQYLVEFVSDWDIDVFAPLEPGYLDVALVDCK
jgi:hypothetical protein